MIDKLEVVLRLLNDNERRVVEALVAEGGSMLQKDISINLGFSRVKTHRVVQSLVKRGLVTVKIGNNPNTSTVYAATALNLPATHIYSSAQTST